MINKLAVTSFPVQNVKCHELDFNQSQYPLYGPSVKSNIKIQNEANNGT